jgi:hypothetical protein
VGRYKVTRAEGQPGVSTGSFRIGRPGQEGSVVGRAGDVVELSDEQLEQLKRSGLAFTETDEEVTTGDVQSSQQSSEESEATQTESTERR